MENTRTIGNETFVTQSREFQESMENKEITEIAIDPVRNEPFRNPTVKIGRNDLCHCGSGKKFKKCHLNGEPPAMATDSKPTK